jgi:hypothetical protein
METVRFENDIIAMCITATSFPAGVPKAHESLHAVVPFSYDRKYFGISYPDKKGNIIYKAAASELKKGELESHKLEPFTIPAGEYFSVIIRNYQQDLPSITRVFDELTSRKDIDPNGFCLEWYFNEHDVRCMVKTKS